MKEKVGWALEVHEQLPEGGIYKFFEGNLQHTSTRLMLDHPALYTEQPLWGGSDDDPLIVYK